MLRSLVCSIDIVNTELFYFLLEYIIRHRRLTQLSSTPFHGRATKYKKEIVNPRRQHLRFPPATKEQQQHHLSGPIACDCTDVSKIYICISNRGPLTITDKSSHAHPPLAKHAKAQYNQHGNSACTALYTI